MLLAIVLSVVAAVFFGATNHIDKYLVSKKVKNVDYCALLLVSTIIAGGMMTLIYLFVCNFWLDFNYVNFLILFVNSVVYVLSVILYYKALARDDATVIAIMLQFIPVFMLLLSPFVLKNQSISLLQLLGGMFITLAAIFLTYEPSRRKFDKERLVTLVLMIFVSLAYAFWLVIERYINQYYDFNQTILWSNITLLLVGLLIFAFVKPFRESFLRMLKTNGVKVIGLNLVNEMFSSFGGVVSNYAGMLISVALVSFITQGVQPFAVMIMGLVLTKLFPKIEKEKIARFDVIKRIVAIAVCAVGLGLIEFG